MWDVQLIITNLNIPVRDAADVKFTQIPPPQCSTLTGDLQRLNTTHKAVEWNEYLSYCTSRTFFLLDLSLDAQPTEAAFSSTVNSGMIWLVLVYREQAKKKKKKVTRFNKLILFMFSITITVSGSVIVPHSHPEWIWDLCKRWEFPHEVRSTTGSSSSWERTQRHVDVTHIMETPDHDYCPETACPGVFYSSLTTTAITIFSIY